MWISSENAGGNHQVRDHNRQLVLRWLARKPGLSRNDIAKQIGLTDPAVSRIVRDLIDAGLVREGGPIVSLGRSGRRHIGLGLVADAASVVAVRLTASDRGVSVVDLAGDRRADVILDNLAGIEPARIPEVIARGVKDAVSRAGVPLPRVLGIGAITVGAADPSVGRVLRSSLPGLAGRLLGPELEARLGRPVRVRTMGQAFSLAEGNPLARRDAGQLSRWRAGDASGAALLVHVALGLGSNLIIAGRPQAGDADERLIGHIPIAGGREPCVCGKIGCLLTEASGHAVMRRLDRRSTPVGDGGSLDDHGPDELRTAVTRANSGDPFAAAAFRTAGQALGSQLFGISAAIAPDRIILAGVVAQARAYAEGVEEGMAIAWSRTDQPAPRLSVSEIDYRRAAELSALDEFLLSSPLDLQPLVAS
jgi:predicted NBD/HSP70 family sugar kinase